MPYTFYLVDVFAETKYAGNQLAVVLNAASISSTEMQNIAREMNYSETTFVLSNEERDGGYDARIFSLDEELPFAGHPTLGTAYIIQQHILGTETPQVKLNLQVGQIQVDFSYSDGLPDILWMTQIEPVFGKIFDAESAAAALSISANLVDQRFPVQEVSTGLPFILVPLIDLNAVRSCRVDQVGYRKLIDQVEAKSIFVFCAETYLPENHLNSRMFDEYHGIAEDPATGSANGCLAAYLVKHRYFGNEQVDVKVEQGYEIGRPSLLLLKAKEERGVININVGGKVIPIAKGELT